MGDAAKAKLVEAKKLLEKTEESRRSWFRSEKEGKTKEALPFEFGMCNPGRSFHSKTHLRKVLPLTIIPGTFSQLIHS